MLQGSWESLVEVEPMPAPPAALGRRLAVAAGALLVLEWPGSPRSQPVCVGVARESLVGVEPTLAPPAVPSSRWLLEAPACAGMAGTGAAEFAAPAPRLRWGLRVCWAVTRGHIGMAGNAAPAAARPMLGVGGEARCGLRAGSRGFPTLDGLTGETPLTIPIGRSVSCLGKIRWLWG